MKRIFASLMVVFMMFAMATSVMAAGFVPSIADKGAPSLVETVDENGEKIIGKITDSTGKVLSCEKEECIIVVPLRDADKPETSEEMRNTLKKVYGQLKDKGAAALPGLKKDDLVIRDLFGLSANCDEMKKFLPIAGNTIALTFDLKLSAKAYVEAMVYVNGAWVKLPVVNNGDGTVTATFEDLGVVAFLTENPAGNPETGDRSGEDLALWISLMAGSAVLIVVLVVVTHRKRSDK